MTFYASQNKGFTLVEIIVSMAIFIIVATVSLGALLKVIDANKKSQSLKTAMTNINFALESMSRELRVGSTYYCLIGVSDDPNLAFTDTTLTDSQPCDTQASGGGNWVLAFKSSKTKTIPSSSATCRLIYAYYFNGFSLYKGEQQNCNEELTFYPVIYSNPADANDVNKEQASIDFGSTRLKVVTNDPSDPGTKVLPYVQLHLSGVSGITNSKAKKKNESPFDMQTTISQRVPD